jgi:thiaminase/transcriptional activator TenA
MSAEETYESYARSTDDPRFTEWLRTRARQPWDEMVGHRFVRECTEGTVSEPVFRAYLKQEYAFVTTSTTGLGYAIAQAPSMRETRHLVEALRGLVTDQRTYFEETFEALGVDGWRDPDLRPSTRHFHDLVVRASATGGYAETLAPMVAAEWVYATWCRQAVRADEFGATGAVRRWIELHDEEQFQEHVAWLRDELDRLGPTLAERRRRAVADIFERVLEQEVLFHAAPYDGGADAGNESSPTDESATRDEE